MTLGEFREVVERKRAAGLSWIQVVVARSRPPKNWSRVRWAAGVYGRCIGEIRPGEYLFDLPLADVERAIKRTSESNSESRGETK